MNLGEISTRRSMFERLHDPDSKVRAKAHAEIATLYYIPCLNWVISSYSMHDSDASEIVVNVLMKLANFHYNPAQRARNWMMKVLKNEAIDHFRRAKRELQVREKLKHLGTRDSEQSDDERFESELRAQKLRVAIETVRDEARTDAQKQAFEAWDLRERLGLQTPEVAKRLGITPGYVNTHIKRVRKLIQAELKLMPD